MNVDTNPPTPADAPGNSMLSTPERFHWHEQSNLCHPDGITHQAKPASPTIVNGVHFINDVNCESSLRAIQLAVREGVEFCVHSDTLSSGKSPDNALCTNYNAHTDKATDNNGAPQAYLQCMSSGSDGKPKRIRRTHASWISSFRINAQTAQLSTIDSYAIIGRLSHSLALYAALEAAWIGADVHALTDLRPDKQFAALTELDSSVLYATPTQLRLLCNSAIKLKLTNATVKHIFCGGGKLDQFTRAQLASQFPNACVKEFYGASETSFITISDELTPVGSVGKLYPGVELKIKPLESVLALAPVSESVPVPVSESDSNSNQFDSTDADKNQPSSIGEIWVKSAYLFEAYGRGDEHDTRWDNGFLCIGEMGYMDDAGNLFLTGRRSRMVNIADNIVFPEQIENVFNEQAAVRHCAVIPVADSKRGSVLVAIVETHEESAEEFHSETYQQTLKQGLNHELDQELDREQEHEHKHKHEREREREQKDTHANAQLCSQLLHIGRTKFGALKAPRKIIFTNNLPLLASGKPDFKKIEKRFNDT